MFAKATTRVFATAFPRPFPRYGYLLTRNVCILGVSNCPSDVVIFRTNSYRWGDSQYRSESPPMTFLVLAQLGLWGSFGATKMADLRPADRPKLLGAFGGSYGFVTEEDASFYFPPYRISRLSSIKNLPSSIKNPLLPLDFLLSGNAARMCCRK